VKKAPPPPPHSERSVGNGN
jgi:syndecan 2